MHIARNDLPVLQIERDDDLARAAGIIQHVVTVLPAAFTQMLIQVKALLELDLIVLGHDALQLLGHHDGAEAFAVGVDLPAKPLEIGRPPFHSVKVRGFVFDKNTLRRDQQQQDHADHQQERQYFLSRKTLIIPCHSSLPSAAAPVACGLRHHSIFGHGQRYVRSHAMSQMRLDKLLSELGVASRSELRNLIRQGRVRVDGAVVTAPEHKVDAGADEISFDGEILRLQRFRYFMMDKPEGVLSVTEDRRQETVLGLLPPELKRLGLFPVGRLDKDTSGLLLLTNDGDFAHRVISPKSNVPKRYRAEVEGVPDEADVRAFAEGIILGDGTHCLPAKLEITGENVCFVTVMEGKYHQVKRMLAACGKPVTHLRRLSVGALELGESLEPGGIRELDQKDLCKVLKDFIIGK